MIEAPLETKMRRRRSAASESICSVGAMSNSSDHDPAMSFASSMTNLKVMAPNAQVQQLAGL